jgi:hypothetical protein
LSETQLGTPLSMGLLLAYLDGDDRADVAAAGEPVAVTPDWRNRI